MSKCFSDIRVFYWRFLSRTVFEIFDFKVFRVWPLTFKGYLRSKLFSPFESPYMISYLTSMTLPVYLIHFSRYLTSNFSSFDLDIRHLHWHLHLGSKIFSLFESPYLTSYLTSNDTYSLSRTVFDIFDFNVSRVWPRPLNSKGHLGSKRFIPFESPYTTSMDTISLSRTVFEIFDFKIFRVWPFTSKGHLGSKNFELFESLYMTSYSTFMDTISLSRTVFEIFDFKVSSVWLDLWPLKVIWGRDIF